jgi:hypothetical protein
VVKLRQTFKFLHLLELGASLLELKLLKFSLLLVAVAVVLDARVLLEALGLVAVGEGALLSQYSMSMRQRCQQL